MTLLKYLQDPITNDVLDEMMMDAIQSENVETIKIVKSLYSEGKKVPDNILRVARNKGLEYVFKMSQEWEKKPEKTNVSSNFLQFSQDMNKMEYYDINQKKLKIVELETVVSTDEVIKEMGEKSFIEATNKCVTDVAKSYGLDVDQNEICNTLNLNTSSENNFRNKSLFIKFWEQSQATENFNVLNLGFFVQHHHVESSDFRGAWMSQEQLLRHKSRMIAILNQGEDHMIPVEWSGEDGGQHAAVVKNWEEMQDKDIRDLYYISLYPVKTIVLTSSGTDTDHMTSNGVYEETIDDEG